jgi:hypothetical protein
MKYLFTFFFLSIICWGNAQSCLKFCVEAAKGAVCLHPSTEFDITKDGGTISLFVKPEDSIGTTQLLYRIYFMDEFGNEKEVNSISQTTKPNWSYAWQDVVFYDPGTYKVKVYRTDARETLLCSGLVKLFCP